jgi:hypothetical protein
VCSLDPCRALGQERADFNGIGRREHRFVAHGISLELSEALLAVPSMNRPIVTRETHQVAMDGLELQEPSRITEMGSMKWNTPDWWFGLLAGMLFGLFIALSIVDGIFQPSTDARGWIGFSGLVGYVIVVTVRGWRLRPKNSPASTQS